MNCNNCIYCNVDYIWDDEAQEEFETASCDKDRDEFENDGEDGHCYTEYPPYIEKSTQCDNCNRLHECIDGNRVLNITVSMDKYMHYLPEIEGCPSNCFEKWRKDND